MQVNNSHQRIEKAVHYFSLSEQTFWQEIAIRFCAAKADQSRETLIMPRIVWILHCYGMQTEPLLRCSLSLRFPAYVDAWDFWDHYTVLSYSVLTVSFYPNLCLYVCWLSEHLLFARNFCVRCECLCHASFGSCAVKVVTEMCSVQATGKSTKLKVWARFLRLHKRLEKRTVQCIICASSCDTFSYFLPFYERFWTTRQAILYCALRSFSYLVRYLP